MAKSAATGFEIRASLAGVNSPVAQRYLLGNSATLKLGDLVRINTSGLLVRCASGEIALGVLVGLVDLNGINVFSPRAQGVAGSTLTPDDQIATSSTNSSDLTRYLKGDVIVDAPGNTLLFNIADSALAQTNMLQFFNVANGNQVTVGSASDTSGQVQLMALDPDGDGNTSKGLFRLFLNQLGLGADFGTAKVVA